MQQTLPTAHPLGEPKLAEKASHVASLSKARSPLPAHQLCQLWPITSTQGALTSSGLNCSYFARWCGKHRCTCLAHRRCFINIGLLSLLFGVLLTGREQPGESERKRLDLRKLLCLSPYKSESSTQAHHTREHDEPQQSPHL